MEWLRIQTSLAKTPCYIGSKPAQRLAWFSLISYCADQENGGIIENCRHWNNKQWIISCGISKSDVKDDCELFRWDGNSLTVAYYPISDQGKCLQLRKNGKAGGLAKAKALADAKAKAVADGPTEERRGEKTIEEEKIEEETVTPCQPPLDFILKDESTWTPDTALIIELTKTSPHIDVMAELIEARDWTMRRKSNRKTLRGMPKFLKTWLNKESRKVPHSESIDFSPKQPSQAEIPSVDAIAFCASYDRLPSLYTRHPDVQLWQSLLEKYGEDKVRPVVERISKDLDSRHRLREPYTPQYIKMPELRTELESIAINEELDRIHEERPSPIVADYAHDGPVRELDPSEYGVLGDLFREEGLLDGRQ